MCPNYNPVMAPSWNEAQTVPKTQSFILYDSDNYEDCNYNVDVFVGVTEGQLMVVEEDVAVVYYSECYDHRDVRADHNNDVSILKKMSVVWVILHCLRSDTLRCRATDSHPDEWRVGCIETWQNLLVATFGGCISWSCCSPGPCH